MRIAVNCDLGEGFGRWDVGPDEQLMKHITAANIACGLHAGDPPRMARTVQMAIQHGVGIGAHPSYPDLQGFGRRFMNIDPDELRDYVTYQIGALGAFVAAFGGKMEHVKPHGALFNRAADDEATAKAVVEGVQRVDPELIIVGLPDSAAEDAARRMGVPFAREVFADRGYDGNGRLLSRSVPGAVLSDPEIIGERVWTMVSEGRVQTADGRWIPVAADTVCVHGDSPGAVDILRHIRETLTQRGVRLCTTGDLIGKS